MCGIFGVLQRDCTAFRPRELRAVVNSLFRLSESRGKEASGVVVLSGEEIAVYKDAVPATRLIRSGQYRSLVQGALSGAGAWSRTPSAIIGHSRLVTDGSQESHENNQPVIAGGVVCVHNGIVVNVEDLWRRFPSLTRRYEVDTEIILALVAKFTLENGSTVAAARRTFALIRGMASVAVLFDDRDELLLATNNGSLYQCTDSESGLFVFASERYILEKLASSRPLRRMRERLRIARIEPGGGRRIPLSGRAIEAFRLEGGESPPPTPARAGRPRAIRDIPPEGRAAAPPLPGVKLCLPKIAPRFMPDTEAIEALRRCTRCILPETMPFIDFDRSGVCNYCRGYRPLREKGAEALEALSAPHRRHGGEPDCVVGMSGGRDSTYGLHYIVTELKMHPVAYTYDWGMVTDLARRNISRICGKLGIEHILVSADIPRKRRYIRANVLAWLKRPDLGMIPLFMAGDKQYFYYANEVKRQTGVELVYLCENMMERTDFKSGFAGIPPAHIDEDHVYTLTLRDKIRIAGYYGRQYLLNPAYINASLPDTLFAYACYYLIRRDYHNLYRYIRWDEQTIISTLRREYDWEVAGDTTSTWRIGDGTASFYNYIYYTVAGFSEIDTLRSNQIRERLLTRDRAMELSRQENQPRFESLKWYCDIIGIDLEAALRVICAAPKLYGRGKDR